MITIFDIQKYSWSTKLKIKVSKLLPGKIFYFMTYPSFFVCVIYQKLAYHCVQSRIYREHFVNKGLVINYGEGGGGYKMGKSLVQNFLHPPPPQDRVKLFAPTLLKSGNFSRPPYNMAKTSSYRVKTTPKLFVPPFSMVKTFSAPPFSSG